MLWLLSSFCLSGYSFKGVTLTISDVESVTSNGVKSTPYASIEKTIINEGTISIEMDSFSDCSSMNEITLPESLIRISRAFTRCSLKSIHLPKNVQFFDTLYMFYDSKNLESITVDDENIFFRSYDGVLYNNDYSKLIAFPPAKMSIRFPTNFKSVGYWGFQTSQIQSISFPNTLTNLSDMTFVDCETTQILFDKDCPLEIIPEDCFHATKITEIFIPKNVIEINITAMASTQIVNFGYHEESKLKTIQDEVFARCINLKMCICQVLLSSFTAALLQDVKIFKRYRSAGQTFKQ